MSKSARYVVITPAKDEEEYIGMTIASMVEQTVSPEKWIIVNDRSTDRTPGIVEAAALRCGWIELVDYNGNPEYAVGAKVVRCFNRGMDYAIERGYSFDFIVKMDADLSFSPVFFEELFDRFNENPRLGIASGTPFEIQHGKRTNLFHPPYHAAGMCKVYRRMCFNDIGGLIPTLSWDNLDNIRGIDRGWETRCFADVYFRHHRPVGGKHHPIAGRLNHGKGAYLIGVDPVYILLRFLHDIFRRPYLLGSLCLLGGYIGAAICREHRISTKAERKILRREMWGSILGRFKRREFILFQRRAV